MVRWFQLICATSVFCALGVAPSLFASKEQFDAQDRGHWAFQKVTRPAPPKVQHPEWIRNPIDSFVAAQLEGKGVEPGPIANKLTLIRRAYLDLVGLPPSPAEIDAFL